MGTQQELLKKRNKKKNVKVGDLITGFNYYGRVTEYDLKYLMEYSDYKIGSSSRQGSFIINDNDKQKKKIYNIFEILNDEIYEFYKDDIKLFLRKVYSVNGKTTDKVLNYFINNKKKFDLIDL